MSDTTNDTCTQQAVPEPAPLAQLAGPPASVLAQLIILTGDEESTAAELALAAGLGRSTTSKALTTLEKHGLAIRTLGGHDGPRRVPDRWRATRTPETSSSHDSGTSEPVPTDSEPSTSNTAESESAFTGCESTPVDATTTESEFTSTDADACVADVSVADTPHNAPHQEDEQPEADAAEDAGARQNRSDDASVAEDTPPAGARSEHPTTARLQMAARSGEKKRLAPGSLRQMVIDYLQAHPGEAFTATKISRVIERSSGAIANALVILVRQGVAEQTSDRPRTYRMATPDGNA
ncbi:helix-turn-helix domain-containing protein [Streptomyces monashensis]|uniref:helix-turn-helix domain-containing protein n=1 Tax=Streptomyces monashensis TaxID=1678012 RepID=UPI0033E013D9